MAAPLRPTLSVGNVVVLAESARSTSAQEGRTSFEDQSMLACTTTMVCYGKGFRMPAVTARGAARRQASEKPRRRKPRGEYAPTAVSVYGEFKARFCATWPLSASFAPPPIMLNPIGSRSVAAPPVFAGELKHLVHVP